MSENDHLLPGTLCLCHDTIWLVVGENRSIALQEGSRLRKGLFVEVSTTRSGWGEGWEVIEPARKA